MSGLGTTVWIVSAAVLLGGGLGPALVLTARGGPAGRLVGLQLAGSVTALLLLVLSAMVDQPSFLIVPLVLVLLSFAGILVFTRLLGTSRGHR